MGDEREGRLRCSGAHVKLLLFEINLRPGFDLHGNSGSRLPSLSGELSFLFRRPGLPGQV